MLKVRRECGQTLVLKLNGKTMGTMSVADIEQVEDHDSKTHEKKVLLTFDIAKEVEIVQLEQDWRNQGG